MARLLHLSDLHLRSDPAKDLIADSKRRAIPAAQQATTSGRLRSTLTALAKAVQDDGLGLDCIVISGDIVDHDPTAYTMLPDVLSPLVPSVVPPERVVIVPGNHDVLQGTAPSKLERYKGFLTLRDFKYVTPYLEGVDIDDNGGELAHHESPTLVAKDKSFVIVAVNSANLCQTIEEADPILTGKKDLFEAGAFGPVAKLLWESWVKRGEQDIAWIGEGQFLRASEALHDADGGDDPIQIAVFHHQLLPVGPHPEIKPYESFLNLGALLEWIASNQIDVTLHGHKHADRVSMMNRGDDPAYPGSIRQTLVVSAPQAGAFDNGNRPIGRLITISGPAPRSGGIFLQDVHAVGSGVSIAIEKLHKEVRSLDVGVGLGVVGGQTAEEVHNKLLSLSGEYTGGGLPLMCRIDNGPSALLVPRNYPDAPVDQEPQVWFDKTVDWWQQRRAGRAATFNHGQRLLAYGSIDPDIQANGLDQINAAADALHSKSESSRAIALLVDPHADLLPDKKLFPAFVFVQFQIVNKHLNITAYFRKQEMPHWWPINVGELARLQAQVVETLALKGTTVAPGSITTMTAFPVAGGSVPRVAVPDLDRRADRSTGMLDLVLPLFNPGDPSGDVRTRWRDAFSDWMPGERAPADGDPIPLYGLKELLAVVDATIAITQAEGSVLKLRTEIYVLFTECDAYNQKEERVRQTERPTWRANVAARVSTIEGLVAAIVEAGAR